MANQISIGFNSRDYNCDDDFRVDKVMVLPKLIAYTLSSGIKEAAWFQANWTDVIDILPKTAISPQCCFLCFQKFGTWIYSDKVPVGESMDKDAPTFIDLWLFGHLIGAPRFQNACLRSNATGSGITHRILQEVFTITFGREKYGPHSRPLIPEALLLFCLHTSLSHSSATMQLPNILRAGGNLAVYAGTNPLRKLKHQCHDCLLSLDLRKSHRPSMDSLCCHAFELDDNVPKKYGGQLDDTSPTMSAIIRPTPNLPRLPIFGRQDSQSLIVRLQIPGSSGGTVETSAKRRRIKEEEEL